MTREGKGRAWAWLSFVLAAACSSGTTQTSVKCTSGYGNQSCDCSAGLGTNTAPCSSDSLGAPARCCGDPAWPDQGACTCEPLATCWQDVLDCTCARLMPVGATAVTSCSPPSQGHCCVDTAQGGCVCSSAACGSSAQEVASCTADNGSFQCSGAQIEVAACR